MKAFYRRICPSFCGAIPGAGAPAAPIRTESGESSSPPRPLSEVIDELEKAHIIRTLEFTKGNRRKAIKMLEVSSDTFYKRLEKFGIQ